jgi:hypothetical protein
MFLNPAEFDVNSSANRSVGKHHPHLWFTRTVALQPCVELLNELVG